jgi:hypothetical protein
MKQQKEQEQKQARRQAQGSLEWVWATQIPTAAADDFAGT